MSGRADAVSKADSVMSAAVGGNHGSRVGPAFHVHPSLSARWTQRSYLELGALPSAVPCARLHARQVVWEWELRERADTVELVVSELVTNAVQASEELGGCQWHGQWIPGPPPVRLWLQADDTTVLMQVWDGSDRMPRRQEPESYGESGRGLILVEALCGQYGVYVLDGASGKVVWGEVAV